MALRRFIHDIQPESCLAVDAARFLLILSKFAKDKDEKTAPPNCTPRFSYVAHFASEYYLQKLDFLLRYPSYFIFELIELHRAQDSAAADRELAISTIRQIHDAQEPEFQTLPFKKFWRGAYEVLDNVEGFWLGKQLADTQFEYRGNAAPWKHYFLTQTGRDVAERLKQKVDCARWYGDRIDQIHYFMGHLTASQIKDRQYQHQRYREANLNELIPDLTMQEIGDNFQLVFNEQL